MVQLILLKDLVIFMLGPTNIGRKTGKLPDAIDFAITHSSLAMGVSLVQYLGQLSILVLLMGHAHLMISCDFSVAREDPFAGANKMLRLDARVAQEPDVGGHPNKLLSGHGFP